MRSMLFVLAAAFAPLSVFVLGLSGFSQGPAGVQRPAPAAQSPAARLGLPQASPAASVSQAVGAATIAIDYHRPAVRGRAIWGELVPYGQVWRAGANEATTIRFSDAVHVAGRDVPAGTYAFFAIPGEKTWTLVLNKQADQWGAFRYDAAADVLRFEVEPRAIAPVEWLRYEIEPRGEDSAAVSLAWEKLAVEFTVSVDNDKILLARIDDAIAHARPDDAAVFLTSARYYLDHGLAPEKALGWVDRSIAISDGWQARECRARLCDKLGRKEEALAAVERAIAIAQDPARGKARPTTLEALERLRTELRSR